MFDTPIIDFAPGPGRLDLRHLPLLVDPDEHESIQIAVANLANDLEKVTGHRPLVWTRVTQESPVGGVILVGSLKQSRFIRELSHDGTNRTKQIEGKWESFHTNVQDCPWPCAKQMLVIAGSDMRGTIFGVYTLSEQAGVSPWYWWADIPVQQHEHIYALPFAICQGEPSVKYRGLFINDEAPALTDWVQENFGLFNSEFYKKFFELLLRLKANFFWPAMWSGFPEPGSSFFADDPKNQEVANAYGIVVSTSHHEPMQRSTTEWRRGGTGPWAWEKNKEEIAQFFVTGAERSQPYESIFTLGMRGEGDGKIDSNDPKATLKDVIKTQRNIIRNTYGREDGVGQVMALYKEVQEYYEAGLEIPEDVTLMFADDNFGNIRRLPTMKERERPGGIGMYYHLEYVGSPRSYKWLNTNSCGKIQQQLHTAYSNGVTQIWIFNVGDIKPLELPATFALTLAWNIDSVKATTLYDFFQAYATREFGPEHSYEISELILGHDRLMALRRHEHIEPDTFSILNYHESETIMERYHNLEHRAVSVFDLLPSSHKAAFFQLVLHPIKASRIYTELRITQAKNQLYGWQRRNTANVLAQRALALFDDDWSLSDEYHNNPWSGKKWNHIVKQPHCGYVPGIWRAPSRDIITGLSFIQRRQNSNRINGQMGVAVEGHAGIRPGLINEESDRMQPSRGDLVPGLTLPPISPYGIQDRYFELYTRGTPTVEWTATVSQDWVCLSPTSGRLSPDDEKDQRVKVKVKWDDVPQDFSDIVHIDIRSQDGEYEQVHLPITKHRLPKDFGGWVESDGYVSLEAGANELNDAQKRDYEKYPYVGRTKTGAIGLGAAVGVDAVWLVYPIFVFSSLSSISISLYFTAVLETHPDGKHSYDFSFDDAIQNEIPLLKSNSKGELPVGWSSAVQDGVWIRQHVFHDVCQGVHSVRYRPLTRGLLLEKIVVDLGGLRESYLGPPQSSFVAAE